jgi:hypothetical protein
LLSVLLLFIFRRLGNGVEYGNGLQDIRCDSCGLIGCIFGFIGITSAVSARLLLLA